MPKYKVEEYTQLELTSEKVRKLIIDIHHYEKNLHMGSTLSCVEILTVLLKRYIRLSGDPLTKDWLVLSKGHAAPALYALLADIGSIHYGELMKLQSLDSILQGHPDIAIPGVDMSTGSLGQGLSFGMGVASWIKSRGGVGRVYVVMGDGEQDEGQVWEAMTDAVHRGLDNLIVIIDFNGYQLDGKLSEVKPKHYMPLIWRTVGWEVFLCDGHAVASIVSALDGAIRSRKPAVIFAKTVRGKGLKQLEDTHIQRVE
ncbi:MAG: 1-deoxy-D-xylulose-5-phosphate synthase N-terminal domain-containing protein [Sulfolobales archaeon]|nr:transketolase [Sulfolobales archaeon]MCX8185901.1 transketolase [Sulfolobales archaeon]MDW7969158.1 1-deoxy-D-xylulose-5-phosphate synthase N-terminal domain-containing protein [Sulfolobales archaeon]